MDFTALIAQTVQKIPPSGIRKFFDLSDHQTISLGIGEPDFEIPESIRGRTLKELSTGRIPYTSNAGMPLLRELIIAYYRERFLVSEFQPEEVLVTVGASEAIDLAIRALCNPGDEVIIPEPCYVSYCPIVVMAGGIPVRIRTTPENGFRLTPDMLEKALTDRTKAVILPYPCNPTGGIMEKADLEALANITQDRDIVYICDEIYAELTYNGKRHISMGALPGMKEKCILLNGFSKAFAMTGWRLGYAIACKEIIGAMTKIHQLTMLCAPTTAQVAGVVALEQGLEDGFMEVERMREEYDRRRKRIVSAFNQSGMPCVEPEGAFYAFPDIRGLGVSSDVFCMRLLQEAKVALIPGTAFGESGEGHIRACYAVAFERIEEAIGRIERFMRKL